MNKLLTTALLVSAAVSSAATISYTGNATTNTSWADINLAKFNSSLGTLTAIQLEVVYSNFGGYFTASAPTVDDAVTVNSASATVYLKQKDSNDVGFAPVNSGSKTLTTTPGLPSSEIVNDSVVFNVSSTTALSSGSSSVSGSYFSLFQDPAGSGNVTFQTRTSPSVNADTAGSGSVNNSTITGSVGMRVTYTYTAAPVPEPSTYGIALGGLALVGAIVRRRKQAK